MKKHTQTRGQESIRRRRQNALERLQYQAERVSDWPVSKEIINNKLNRINDEIQRLAAKI